MSEASDMNNFPAAEVVLPEPAIYLLYEVLGHFPHDPLSWSNAARASCTIALWDCRHKSDVPNV